jgi:hypothetical protein
MLRIEKNLKLKNLPHTPKEVLENTSRVELPLLEYTNQLLLVERPQQVRKQVLLVQVNLLKVILEKIL